MPFLFARFVYDSFLHTFKVRAHKDTMKSKANRADAAHSAPDEQVFFYLRFFWTTWTKRKRRQVEEARDSTIKRACRSTARSFVFDSFEPFLIQLHSYPLQFRSVCQMIELSAIYREYVCACCLRWEYSPLKIGRSRNKSWTRCVCVCVLTFAIQSEFHENNILIRCQSSVAHFAWALHERERARVFLGFCFRIKCGLRGWKHVSILLEVAGCACGCVCLHLSFLHALSRTLVLSRLFSLSPVFSFLSLSRSIVYFIFAYVFLAYHKYVHVFFKTCI